MQSPSSTTSPTNHTSVEVEQLLLGALLTQGDVLSEVADRLEAKHFHEEAHRDIYKIIVKLVSDGREPSPITVSSAIGNNDIRDYLGTLVIRTKDIIDAGIDHSVVSLSDEIIDLYNRRQLAAAAEQAAKLTLSSSSELSTRELHRRIEDLLVSLPTAGDGHKLKTSGEIAIETIGHAERIFTSGEQPGVYSGFVPFDNLIGPMVDGDMIVVGGATSSGKTSLVQQIAFMVAQEEPVLAMSLEMAPRQWNDRYITQLTGISSEKLEMGPFDDRDFEKIDTAWRSVLSKLKMVIGGKAGMTVSQIAAYARRVKRRFGMKLMIIDHLGFIRHPNPNATGPDKIADITLEIKSMAQALEVPVIVVSHINRESAKRDNYRPTLSDLFGSSAIEKDADTVMFVHRLHYWLQRKGPELHKDRTQWELEMRAIENDAEFILAKRRRGSGAGIIDVGWSPELTMFYEK